VRAVDLELLGGKLLFARGGVERLGLGEKLVPRAHRRNVHSMTPGSGVTRKTPMRGSSAEGSLDLHGERKLARRSLDGGAELDVRLEVVERRHEDVQQPLPRLDAERAA